MKLLNLFFIWSLILTNISNAEISIKTILPIKIFISIADNIYRTDDDIILNIEVNNLSSEPISFYKSDNKLNNFRINILNLNNASLLDMKDISYSDAFNKREFTLFPDEVYKVKLNLKDYFQFPKEGRYKIKVEFDPYLNKSIIYTKYISNPIYLNLKPSLRKEQEDQYIADLIKKEKEKTYTPEETIKAMLDARKKHDWKNYFRYQNLNKIILQNDIFKKKFLNASNAMKKKLIKAYKNYIKARKDYEIESYEITLVTHSYTRHESTVECTIFYKKPAIYRAYSYIFKLKQKGNKWIIDDYDTKSYIKRK